MHTLNDWPAPSPPTPAPPTTPIPLSRGAVAAVIFERTIILASFGGMAMGVLCVARYGWGALFAIPLGGLIGLPLGLFAGVVLAIVGALLLVPYRGPVVAIVVLGGLASCIVMGYLGLGLAGMAEAGSGEGPQSTNGPSWDWLLMSASAAAALLSPWLVWWYVKRMEANPS